MLLLLYDLWMYFLCYVTFLNSLFCLFLVHFSAPFLVCWMFWHSILCRSKVMTVYLVRTLSLVRLHVRVSVNNIVWYRMCINFCGTKLSCLVDLHNIQGFYFCRWWCVHFYIVYVHYIYKYNDEALIENEHSCTESKSRATHQHYSVHSFCRARSAFIYHRDHYCLVIYRKYSKNLWTYVHFKSYLLKFRRQYRLLCCLLAKIRAVLRNWSVLCRHF